MNRSVASLLDEAVARFGDRPAMDFLGRRWRYAALGRLVERAAAGLAGIGVGPGTRVGLCLPNTPYSLIFYYATLRLNAVVVNYNPLYVERELTNQIVDSSTEIMVTIDLPAIFGKVERVATGTTLRRIVLCPLAGVLPYGKGLLYRAAKRREIARPQVAGLTVRYRDLMRQRATVVPATIDPVRDIAVLQYTGGTTGVPKAAMLTHANLMANCHQVAAHMPSLRPGRERIVAVLPFFHVFAMTAVLNVAVEIGAELVLLPRFQIDQLMATIARRRPSMMFGVPTIYGAMIAALEKKPTPLTGLRLCVSGGAPLPIELGARFTALTGLSAAEGYGLTEASPVITCNPPDGVIRAGSIGTPMVGCVVDIRDPTDPARVLKPGERGELCVRGPQVMAGYLNRPEETAAVMTPDGALRTGDIGYADADGYFYLVDRIKDVILCGGYNVYPRVIEEALYQHPAVAEAVVIGVADSYRGQAPKAFVTLRDGNEATPEAIRAFLVDHVSKIELPRDVVIRDSLPKTMIGKLSKKDLVAEEAAMER